MRNLALNIFVCGMLCLSATVAIAADSCSSAVQPDGSTWETCVDGNGHMYCESCPKGGGACQRVACK